MIFERKLSVALRANRAARICRSRSLGGSNPPFFFGILGSETVLTDVVKAAFFFCSSAGGGRDTAPPDQIADALKAADENLSLDRIPALPLSCYPLLPSKIISIIKDPVLLASVKKFRKTGISIAGAFLLKDERFVDQSVNNLKGEKMLKNLHDVGTLVEITHIQEDEVWLRALSRLQISEMVEADPLTVRAVRLKDVPYSNNIPTHTKATLVETNRDIQQFVEFMISRYALLSDMDFGEDSKFFPDAIKMQNGDVSYVGDCADSLASVMTLDKDLKQYLLEELDAMQRCHTICRLAGRTNNQYLCMMMALDVLGYDSNQFLVDFIKKVSDQEYTLSYCRSTLLELIRKGGEKVDSLATCTESGTLIKMLEERPAKPEAIRKLPLQLAAS